ncbi:nucleic-acid-binding protein from transposon X-element [Trichonephila clavata]|uniref:Nucleic-acid-binding protein from transposon X-element n=1 Tax=Trichonephila clavata TaxID=2740835 RepID=A0A8X6FZP1_TRICU|nr:nucleic-acid-binding protein from transposon X-element [Trichonephila clavata]
MDFCVLLDNVIQGIDTYDFQTTTGKNEFSYAAYNLQEEVRSRYVSLKKTEMDMERETHDDLLKQWGILTEKEIAEFVPVVNKRQKSRPLSPVIDTSSANKKPRTDSNQFQILTVDDLPEVQQDKTAENQMEIPSRSSSPVQKIRPPPPITIDNFAQPAQLLKKIQELTKQKITARSVGKSMKLFPETPAAYYQIRALIEELKLEAFTFQFPAEQEYKVVIRGMPADMPVEEVIQNLEELGIHPKECKVLINRRTNQPMPIFAVFLAKNADNKNIYNLKELCSLKIIVETMRRKYGPAQCYRCQGFFHSSKFCTRNPKCVKCGKPHLTRDCMKTKEEEPTCCHCQGNHPANYIGCPRNPLNRPPPPPKVNYWEERAKKRTEMQAAAKARATLSTQSNIQAEATTSSVQRQATSSAPKTQVTPSSHLTQVTPSSLQSQTNFPPLQNRNQTQETSSSHPTSHSSPTDPTKTSMKNQDHPSLMDTFSQVNDPEVQEMIEVVQQFITISKSNKSRAQRAMEIFSLLRIKF